jgi:hypothetical protein
VPRARSQTLESASHLRRFVDFAEPHPDDTCLDVAAGDQELAAAIGPRVRKVTSADITRLPAGPFTLVTARLVLARSPDPVRTLRELLHVCAGRLMLADLVRTRAGGGGHIEQLRDPARCPTRTLAELTALLGKAGGQVHRLELFTIERPVDSWLGRAAAAERIRSELTAELDGGPSTGARPRLIGGELWFAQSWAYIAATPLSRRPAARARRRR